MAEKYIGEMLLLWKRMNIHTGKTDEASKIITREKCVMPKKGPYDDKKGQPGFDRLTIILPKTVSTILVYPPVKGDPSIFQAILEHINEKRFHKQPDTVILFAPPFYSIDKDDDNKNILANFLKFKLSEETDAIVHILTQHTDANKMIGCKLYSQEDKPNKPLINMLEPTYVIYPFTRIVGDSMAGSILFTACSTNEVNLPASNMRQISSVSSYFSGGGRGSLAYPPDITKDDYFINKMLPPSVYRFYGNRAHTFDNNYIIMDLKGGDDTDYRMAFGESIDKFVGLDDDRLSLDGIDTEIVPISDMQYSVRKPTPEVRNDWSKMKFTMDEAELLNNLQITPSILNSEVFRGDGNGMLVKFLANLINSKCYTDKDLLTKEECSISEDFIDKIYSHLLENDTRIHEGIQATKSIQLRQEENRKREEEAMLRAESAEGELERLKEANKIMKARFGLDDSVTDESLQKDPYEDGVLVIDEGTDEPEFNTEFLDLRNGKYHNKYYMFIGSTNRVFPIGDEEGDEGELIIGRMYVDVKKEEEVSAAVDVALKKISQDYPGWNFFKEIGDKEPDNARPATPEAKA
jgi:hypothetical protein